MIIGIDGNEANIENRVGSNEYAVQILKNIWEIRNSKHEIRNKLHFIIYLKDKPLSDLPRQTDWWKYKVLSPKFLWTQWRLPLELILRKEKPDVFFTPGHYAPRFCSVPLVISIMDLAFLRYPKQFRRNDLYQLINWTKYSVEKARHIFTISEFTKKEIIHFYKYPENKITVTYPGITEPRTKPSSRGFDGELSRTAQAKGNPELRVSFQKLRRKYKIKGKYFLYIGTLQPRKNLVRLIEAFSETLKLLNSKTLKLIIVGKKGWLYEDIFKKVKELNLQNKVIFTGFIPEEEKTVLLRNALVFILPSLYEGFGIPVLEAMQQGCPVIVSKTSSLPEVVGKAGVYINNPCSVDSIYQAMLKMVKLDKNQRKELTNKGFKQIKKFSWKETAEKTLEILIGIVDS